MLRISYALLILWQPIWHGWLVPERYWLGLFLALPLLLPSWGIYKQYPRSQAIGGFLAIFYFVFAAMLLLSLSWPAIVQIGLCSFYLGLLMTRGWRLRQTAKKTKKL